MFSFSSFYNYMMIQFRTLDALCQLLTNPSQQPGIYLLALFKINEELQIHPKAYAIRLYKFNFIDTLRPFLSPYTHPHLNYLSLLILINLSLFLPHCFIPSSSLFNFLILQSIHFHQMNRNK